MRSGMTSPGLQRRRLGLLIPLVFRTLTIGIDIYLDSMI